VKTGGAGLRIDYGFTETPFGEALIAETRRGICHLSFIDGQGRNGGRDLLASQWSGAKLHRDDSRAAELSDKIFTRQLAAGAPNRLRAFIRATPFQLRVWRALLRVPPGALTTYGRLSNAIGQPRAARAVGGAVGANPIAIIIPCHRVIRETGALGDYHWDPIRKRAIVGWEISSRFATQRDRNDRPEAIVAA
jgi:AraC family transcriptional regulator of adaptative response/methylated-DNA-[protein]-cysteine methyltransferase